MNLCSSSLSSQHYSSSLVNLCYSNKSIINLLYFNARSLLPKIDELRIICTNYSPGIICVVETWLDETVLDSEISIQNYSLCRLDRSRHGGGVLIYVNNLFNYSIMFKGALHFECLIVSVNCHARSSLEIIVVLSYRPPNSGHAPLDSLLSTLCNTNIPNSSKVCLVGDFNIDFFAQTTSLYFKLLSVVSCFNLTQVVSEPTCVTDTSLANADHHGLWIAFSTTSRKCIMKPITRKVWRYAHADWEKAEELLNCIEWDSLLSTDVNECWSTWKNMLLKGDGALYSSFYW